MEPHVHRIPWIATTVLVWRSPFKRSISWRSGDQAHGRPGSLEPRMSKSSRYFCSSWSTVSGGCDIQSFDIIATFTRWVVPRIRLDGGWIR
jgi:hypothetical protein